MFFGLNSDKNDAISPVLNNGSDRFVIKLPFRCGTYLRTAGNHVLGALLLMAVTIQCVWAAPPLFDTTLRIGTPLFARLQFPGSVRASQGLIRLPTESEVLSIGGQWLGVYESLELVPSVTNSGVYYLSSRQPIDRRELDFYLARETTESLDIFVFEVRLVGDVTRVATRSLKTEVSPSSSYEARPPSAQSYSDEGGLTRQSLVIAGPSVSSPSEAAVESTKTPDEVDLDDDLSERLRELIAAQAADYQARNSSPADKTVDERATELTNRGSLLADASDQDPLGEDHRDTADTVENTSQISLSTSDASQPIANSGTFFEPFSPPAQKPISVFDGPLSIADLLLIMVVGSMVYFGRTVIKLKSDLLNSEVRDVGARYGRSAPAADAETASTNLRARGASDASETTSSGSALADILRTTAEQAERSERLSTQSRLDARLATFASAQQQALFECATRLQTLAMATDFSGGAAISGVVPPSTADAPASPVPPNQTSAEQRPTAGPEEAPARPQSQASESLQSDSNRTLTPRGSAAFPADQRRMVRRGGVEPKSAVTPGGPTRRQGPPPAKPVPPQPVSTDKPPAPGQDYSEQMSLAAVYFNMGEVETARELLETVIKDGSAEEKAEARKFMQENFDG